MHPGADERPRGRPQQSCVEFSGGHASSHTASTKRATRMWFDLILSTADGGFPETGTEATDTSAEQVQTFNSADFGHLSLRGAGGEMSGVPGHGHQLKAEELVCAKGSGVHQWLPQ